jgi:hypothetical protein
MVYEQGVRDGTALPMGKIRSRVLVRVWALDG